MKMINVLGVAAAAGILMLAAYGRAQAAEPMQMKPSQGLSFDVGAKRAVTYYRAEGGICNLTLLLSDRAGEQGPDATPASRLTIPVLPGKSARIDTVEGKSMEFQCRTGGGSMTIKALDQVAWSRTTS